MHRQCTVCCASPASATTSLCTGAYCACWATLQCTAFCHAPLHLKVRTLRVCWPQARIVSQAVAVDQKVWVMGGWDPGSSKDGGAILDDVWCLDLATKA